MRLAKKDGNSSMGSFLSHYVKDWLLSTAFEDTEAVGLHLSGVFEYLLFCLKTPSCITY